MSKRRVTVIAEYVERRLEVKILKRQLEADPTRGKDRVWLHGFNEALAAADLLLRSLRGSDLGLAERMIRERETAPPPDA